MPRVTAAAKRLLVGRPFRSERLSNTLLPKRLALPMFASDALSSVAYAPAEIFTVLSVAGLSAYAYTPWIAVLVCLVMVVVVASYRQNVHAYPSGGGDYEVATENLGPDFGLVVGSALLVDYILTVAVSAASGVANVGSAIAIVGQHPVWAAVVVVLVVTGANLRGIRESGAAFAVPVYAFIFAMMAMLATGIVRWLLGSAMRAESAGFDVQPEHAVSGFALVFLLARAFSSGSAALTGVEAVSNGVPAFRKPKSRNAATTLTLMGVLAVTMMIGLVSLALITKARVTDDPGRLIGAPADYHPKTLIAQIAQAVFSGFPVAFYFLSITTGIILFLACNTAFSGFPVLGSVLAQNRYLPRQLHTRGDRLAFSNGIVLLSFMALVLLVAFRADVTALIHLYVVGVFVSFTCSQAGMIRHWNRLLRSETEASVRRRMRRSQTINAVGFTFTAVVLLIVLVTKFLAGAWIAVAGMAMFFVLMKAIRRHYDQVARETEGDEEDMLLPGRVHAIVLVSRLHLPTMRALAYARATRADSLEAVTVNVDLADTRALVDQWDTQNLPVPLKVLESPYREVTRPILDYVRRLRDKRPNDLVVVYIPEYVLGRWWEQLLHNQSALRIKARLLFTPGVMVTSVPWQLASSRGQDRRVRARANRELQARPRHVPLTITHTVGSEQRESRDTP
ncbi:APC family permease [Nocardia aurantia]|uniref:APC family permease n=1 Tax=Nocardia aurantia TaxID=2585199 RepID=UPI0029E7F04E|nr:APC family permease [Nocardia aurantia]